MEDRAQLPQHDRALVPDAVPTRNEAPLSVPVPIALAGREYLLAAEAPTRGRADRA